MAELPSVVLANPTYFSMVTADGPPGVGIRIA
jgi:hypothetical protein